MQVARYFSTGTQEDPETWGHYALAVPLYTHFTSPIRRYPDVLVHRLLAAAIAAGSPGAPPPLNLDDSGLGRATLTAKDVSERAASAQHQRGDTQLIEDGNAEGTPLTAELQAKTAEAQMSREQKPAAQALDTMACDTSEASCAATQPEMNGSSSLATLQEACRAPCDVEAAEQTESAKPRLNRKYAMLAALPSIKGTL